MKRIPFQTSQEQRFDVEVARSAMFSLGELDPVFIQDACDLASYDQGVYDLLMLWLKAPSSEDEDILVADIKEAIKDYNYK